MAPYSLIPPPIALPALVFHGMILVILGSNSKMQVPVNYTISRGNNRYCEIHFFFFLAKVTLSR